MFALNSLTDSREYDKNPAIWLAPLERRIALFADDKRISARAATQQLVMAPPRAVLSTGVVSDRSATWGDATRQAIRDTVGDGADSETAVLPRPRPAHLAHDSTGENESWRAACYEATVPGLGKGKNRTVDKRETLPSRHERASAWEGPFSMATDRVKLTVTIASTPKTDRRLGYSVLRLHSVLADSAPPESIWLRAHDRDFDPEFEDKLGRVRVKLESPLMLTDGWQATEAWIELDPSLDWSRTAREPLIAEDVTVIFYASAPGMSAPLSVEGSQAGPSRSPLSSQGNTCVYGLCRRASLTSDIRQRISVSRKTRRSKRTAPKVILSLEDRGPTHPASKSLMRRQWNHQTLSGTVELGSIYLVPRTDTSILGQQIKAIVLDGCEPSEISLENWSMKGEYTVSVITHDGAQ